MYNDEVVSICMKFILHATSILKNQNFWVAFQSNALSDRCAVSNDFESKFNEMIEHLEKQLEYFVPKMHLNMRNSREVVENPKQDVEISSEGFESCREAR